VIHDSLWDDVLLHICRLLDPPQSGKDKENLTLRRLPPLVDPSIRADVERLLTEAQTKTAFARDIRNRHIGHIDVALALE
jgi:hypothetical protein